MKWTALPWICLLLAAPAVADTTPPALFSLGAVAASVEAGPGAVETHWAVVQPHRLNAATTQLGLQLPGLGSRIAVSDDLEDRGPGFLTWRGRLRGDAESRVTLTRTGTRLSGLIQTSAATYELRPVAGGHVVERLDHALYPPCGGGLEAPGTSAGESPLPSGTSSLVDGVSTIDVMVLYTPQARDGAGGVPEIENVAQAAVDAANTAFIDSDMVARFNLVHTALSTRNDSGDMGQDLDWLVNDSGVATLRDQQNADLVSLLLNGGGFCGLGYVMRNPGAGFAPFAFQVTARGCAVGNLSWAHEHGHNLGFEHDPANGINPARASFTWSFGHFVDGSYRTVMSYASECNLGCTRVAHFSNPMVTHAGAPTGITNLRDNHRSGNATAPIAAAFRDSGILFRDGFEQGNLSGWSATGN